jgi:hypothetical protein
VAPLACIWRATRSTFEATAEAMPQEGQVACADYTPVIGYLTLDEGATVILNLRK